jgi:hypothetical protein
MKKTYLFLIFTLKSYGNQCITEVDQTKPLYFPVQEYTFEIKNKSSQPITITLTNGQKTIFIKQPVNLCARVAGLKPTDKTYLFVTTTAKNGTTIERLYSFDQDKKIDSKRILVTWTGSQLKPQGGNFIYYRSMSGIPLKDNIKKVTLVSSRELNHKIGDEFERKKS